MYASIKRDRVALHVVIRYIISAYNLEVHIPFRANDDDRWHANRRRRRRKNIYILCPRMRARIIYYIFILGFIGKIVIIIYEGWIYAMIANGNELIYIRRESDL